MAKTRTSRISFIEQVAAHAGEKPAAARSEPPGRAPGKAPPPPKPDAAQAPAGRVKQAQGLSPDHVPAHERARWRATWGLPTAQSLDPKHWLRAAERFFKNSRKPGVVAPPTHQQVYAKAIQIAQDAASRNGPAHARALHSVISVLKRDSLSSPLHRARPDESGSVGQGASSAPPLSLRAVRGSAKKEGVSTGREASRISDRAADLRMAGAAEKRRSRIRSEAAATVSAESGGQPSAGHRWTDEIARLVDDHGGSAPRVSEDSKGRPVYRFPRGWKPSERAAFKEAHIGAVGHAKTSLALAGHHSIDHDVARVAAEDPALAGKLVGSRFDQKAVARFAKLVASESSGTHAGRLGSAEQIQQLLRSGESHARRVYRRRASEASSDPSAPVDHDSSMLLRSGKGRRGALLHGQPGLHPAPRDPAHEVSGPANLPPRGPSHVPGSSGAVLAVEMRNGKPFFYDPRSRQKPAPEKEPARPAEPPPSGPRRIGKPTMGPMPPARKARDPKPGARTEKSVQPPRPAVDYEVSSESKPIVSDKAEMAAQFLSKRIDDVYERSGGGKAKGRPAPTREEALQSLAHHHGRAYTGQLIRDIASPSHRTAAQEAMRRVVPEANRVVGHLHAEVMRRYAHHGATRIAELPPDVRVRAEQELMQAIRSWVRDASVNAPRRSGGPRSSKPRGLASSVAEGMSAAEDPPSHDRAALARQLHAMTRDPKWLRAMVSLAPPSHRSPGQ